MVLEDSRWKTKENSTPGSRWSRNILIRKEIKMKLKYINWEKEIKKKLERHGAFDFDRLEEQTGSKNPNFEELRGLFGDTFYFSGVQH